METLSYFTIPTIRMYYAIRSWEENRSNQQDHQKKKQMRITRRHYSSEPSSPPKMEIRLYSKSRTRTRTRATPMGEPLTRWMDSGWPVEKKPEKAEPVSEERKMMTRRRPTGRSRRPTGLKSSAMNSVRASPWSPTMSGTTITATTTTANRTPYGAPPWRSWSIIFSVGGCLVGGM